MEFLALSGLALLALALLGGTHGGSAADDLKRLAKDSPEAFGAVNGQLGNPNPAVLMQLAAQLLSKYPALAKDLGEKAAALVVPFTGASGTAWNLFIANQTPTSRTVQVMLGGMPVLSYSAENDPGVPVEKNRKLLGPAPGADSATVAKARSDFGI
jgi:hypothetical protein